MERFQVQRSNGAWRVVDTKTGHLHSAAIKDKARAKQQAATLNARVGALGFPRAKANRGPAAKDLP